MEDKEILQILKMDLQMSTTIYDTYLNGLMEFAKAAIAKEGIKLSASVEDGMLVEMYTAFLYRKRRENIPFPRSLRYALNNRLLSQKGKVVEDE